MNRKIRCVTRLSALIIALTAVGCATQSKNPVEKDPKLLAIDEIVILPAVDLRIDKKIKVNFEKQLQEATLKIVTKKRYQAVTTDIIGDVDQITEEDLSTLSPDWIKKLGPKDSRYVMLPCLDDVATKLTFGSSGNAVVSAYLYDKEDGTLLWKNKAVGQAGQGGLLGMAMKGMMANEAISIAVSRALGPLQKQPKSK